MRKVIVLAAVLALTACGEKKTQAGTPAAGRDSMPAMQHDSMMMHHDSMMPRDTTKKN